MSTASPSGRSSRRSSAESRSTHCLAASRRPQSPWTTACATCRKTAHIAELIVYTRAPGTLVRCRRCSTPLIVFIACSQTTCLDLTGVPALDTKEEAA
jgi:uncharacterized protein DUF6510